MKYKILFIKISLMTILFFNGITFGQQLPGGISGANIEYWLKADEVSASLPADDADVTFWQDLSGNSRNFSNTESTPFFPKFKKSAMNYHSAVDFYFLDPDEGGPTLANNRRRKLQTTSNFAVDANRSYFVIYISRLDDENSNTYASVFSMNRSSATTSANQNSYGWRSAGNLWNATRGTNYTHTSVERTYGIGIAVLPNIATTDQQQYINSLPSSFNGRTLETTAQPSILGNSNVGTGTNNYFFGEVMEVIVLSKPGTGNTLSSDELKRINSHLAIKYGITLNAVQTEYLLSDGSIVYNSSATGYTTYNKDIFGIARDDASGLYQKQSMSTENAALTVYQGTLAETNAENTSTLTDKHALMFGANGVSGNSSYSHEEGTQFQNYTLQTFTDPVTGVVTTERLTSIFNYKLRAKTTGQSSFTVNLKPGMGEWVLISNDASFTPANTRIYKIIDGKVENIVINDGDYIGFAFYLKAPGGVTNGLRMWLNASKSNTISLNGDNEVVNWTDYAGFGTTYSKIVANSTAPLYLECDPRTNFHPTVHFRKDREYLSTLKAPMSVADPQNTSHYFVVNGEVNSYAYTYFASYGNSLNPSGTATTRPAFSIDRDGKGRFRSTGPRISSVQMFNFLATTIAGYHWDRGNTIEFEFDGYSNIVNHTSNLPSMNRYGILGAGYHISTSNFEGIMSEGIAYEGTLTQAERNRINSYLGLKYALTIDLDKTSTSTNFNYLLSDGTSIWNGNDATHLDFHNNVASVVRDDDADLYNRQSRSTDIGAIVHMGVGSKLGCDPQLNDILEDKTAITWGHNNAPVATYSLIGNPDVCGEMDSRLNGRVWLVDNTNFNQEILVGAAGASFPYNGANYQVFMLVADSPAKLAANNWDQIIPMTFSDGMHVVNYKFTDNYTYFTFGAKVIGSCDGCDFDGVKKLDFTRQRNTSSPTGTWIHGEKGPRTYNLGDNFNVTVTVEDPNNRLRNNYPRASSQKTLRKYRNGTESVTTKIAFKDDLGDAIAAATSFEIYDIDRTASRPDDVQIIGYCNGSPVYPKLTYTYSNPTKSRYNIKEEGFATAKVKGERYNGNSGYTSKRGRVFVDFENAVEEIHVIYKTKSTNSLSTYIGIGPIEFYCPAPLPAPNEDGLIFVKQGTTEAKLCEVVDYTFRVINTNCAEKEVVFTDTLPTGMIWVDNSLSAGEIAIDDTNITGYGTPTLTVSKLMIPGGGATFTFRASAVFENSATAGIYKNQAALEYDRLGTTESLKSTDRLTGNEFTETLAIDSDRPEQIITSITADKSCFKLNGEIEITVNINNPNTFNMTDMFLALSYDDEIFTVVPNSLVMSTGLTLPSDSGEPGNIEFDNFTLPTGTHWVKFKVLSSNDLAEYEINPDTLNPDDITFSYELISESDDVCLSSSTAFSNGELELSFCTFCTKPSVGGAAVDSKVGISVMKEQLTGWPENVPNGYLVLEAGKQGMVLTRTTPDAIGLDNWVEGMIIFDISADKKCISIYNGTEWKCIERSCND